MPSFLFTQMSLSLSGADNNTELHLTLPARTTLIEVSASATVSILGLLASAGNTDGLVVCFSSIGGAFTVSFAHEDAGASAPGNRFRNTSLGAISVLQYGAQWYRYTSAASRWQAIGHA